MMFFTRCLCLLLVVYSSFAHAQCINTFPYTEDFEATNGNWASGGTGDDWAWGQVSKSIITQAASGNNCWVVGGLTNSFYNLGERSFVASPCFDLSSLQNPYISFNLFWESERHYDGATFQYSFDSITWVNLGSWNEMTICNGGNWFTSPNITNLSGLTGVLQGWSGTTIPTQGSCQGSGGSNGWIVQNYCMAQLKGQSRVYFRFAFGAGTQCNDFDGFAFDDVYIGEAPASDFYFLYNCTGNQISCFTMPSVIYECLDSFFVYVDGKLQTTSIGGGLQAYYITMDPATIASQGFNPTFPHTITMTYKGPCHDPLSYTKVIPDFQYTLQTTPLTCNNTQGALELQFTGGSAPQTIRWQNLNTSSNLWGNPANNLPAGNYIATLTDDYGCTMRTDTFTLTQPDSITPNITVIADTCHFSTGNITTNPSGGNMPYQYQWSNGSTDMMVNNVPEGIYIVTISDADGCAVTTQAAVPYTSGMTFEVLLLENVSCFGSNDGKATIQVTGGVQPYSYLWSNNKNTAAITKLPEGVYTLQVTDNRGCIDSTKVEVEKIHCDSYVDFPTAFSPNGDGVNDVFRARYSPDVNKFSLLVYNRWGELVFASDDIMEGWNGTYKNVAQPMGTFVWVAQFSFADGSSKTTSGNVTLMR